MTRRAAPGHLVEETSYTDEMTLEWMEEPIFVRCGCNGGAGRHHEKASLAQLLKTADEVFIDEGATEAALSVKLKCPTCNDRWAPRVVVTAIERGTDHEFLSKVKAAAESAKGETDETVRHQATDGHSLREQLLRDDPLLQAEIINERAAQAYADEIARDEEEEARERARRRASEDTKSLQLARELAGGGGGGSSGGSARGTVTGGAAAADGDDDAAFGWRCSQCTFRNEGQCRSCEMCGGAARPDAAAPRGAPTRLSPAAAAASAAIDLVNSDDEQLPHSNNTSSPSPQSVPLGAAARPTAIELLDDDDAIEVIASAARAATRPPAAVVTHAIAAPSPAAAAAQKGKRKRKAGPEPAAMHQGVKMAIARADVDCRFDSLLVAEREALLRQLLPRARIGELQKFRKAFDASAKSMGGAAAAAAGSVSDASKISGASGGGTLWELVIAAADRFPDGTAANETADGSEGSSAGEAAWPEVLIAPHGARLSGHAVLRYLRRWVAARHSRAAHAAALDGIESVDASSSANPGDWHPVCCICADSFRFEDTVPCSTASHYICKPCFSQYCVVTVGEKGVGLAGVPCPVDAAACGVLQRADVAANLAAWDQLELEEKERARSERLLLAGKGSLHCTCGAIAVLPDDLPGKFFSCPGAGCGRRYCAECGNAAHDGAACPPPSDMVNWINKKTKPCPKCKQPIEKNAGCTSKRSSPRRWRGSVSGTKLRPSLPLSGNHMTCAPPAGCGFEFCWLCLGPYPHCNCGHFEAESERAAQQLQRRNHHAAGAFAGDFVPPPFGGGGGFGFPGGGFGGGGRGGRPRGGGGRGGGGRRWHDGGGQWGRGDVAFGPGQRLGGGGTGRPW